MQSGQAVRRFSVHLPLAVLFLTACASSGFQPLPAPETQPSSAVRTGAVFEMANRLTWGARASEVRAIDGLGIPTYLQAQLHPSGPDFENSSIQAQIAEMSIVRRPVAAIVQDMEQRRKDADAISNDEEKKAAQQAYQRDMNLLARESASRHILRTLYSHHQVLEQMTWFWMNHFSVHQYKSNVRALVGDYEENAIRAHALGKFRDLLGAVAHHPAMLRYLDNEQNAAGHINENYARELMELHTLGVDAGYSQRDVQELARVLTGVGVNLNPADAKVRKDLQPYYVRQGLFEFNPNRHDFGEKTLLGQPIRSRGLAELDEALDRLARHPATARFVSRKLALYWMSDEPSPALIARMAQTFESSDGDIARILEALFTSPEFARAGGQKFKDPMHYVISAVRFAYDDKAVLNVSPILNWLNRMGEPLYGRQTPDGYPLTEQAWASAGQMATRFEIAKAIGSGSAGLFRTEGPDPREVPAFPRLANGVYFSRVERTLSAPTRAALDQAASPQEWNAFLLSSPEFMKR
jgi:uncharacterized protein (DUF1800 family)